MSPSAYRVVRLDHPVPWRIIGPDGQQDERLCAGLSLVACDLDNDKLARRYFASFAEMMSAYLRAFDDGVAVLLRDRLSFQATIRRALKAVGATYRTTDQVEWVTPPDGLHSRISDFLIVTNKLGEVLRDACFGGNNPAQRTIGRKLRFDTGRRFRMGSDRERQPRFEDPRVWDRWRASLTEMMAPECFPVMGDIARYAGKRGKQVRAVTLYDVYVAPAKPLTIMFPRKGGRAAHDEEGYVPQTIQDRLDAYVDGPRARLSGMSLETIRTIAANSRRVRELKVPLFTEDGIGPVSEGRMYRVFRMAAVRASLFFDTEDFRVSGKRKYVTFHYLRHEYVHRRLDEIMLQAGGDRAALEKALIDTMNWRSGQAMLAWYSRHHALKVARETSATFNERVDVEVGKRLAPAVVTSPIRQTVEVDRFNGELV